MKTIFTSLILILSFSLNIDAQQIKIPVKKNETNANGQKEGTWCLWYTKSWGPTDIKDSVAYYRIITYKNGKPIGVVKDHYLNGKVQWAGRLLSDNPDVIDGIAIWYHPNGKKNSIANFVAGNREGTTYEYNDKEIKIAETDYKNNGQVDYRRYNPDGTLYFGWVEARKKSKESATLPEAIKWEETALEKAKDEYGIKSQYYAISLYSLGVYYQKASDFVKAENYLIQYVNLVAILTSDSSEDFANAVYDLAGCYEKASKFNLAAVSFYKAANLFEKIKGSKSQEAVICLHYTALNYEKAELNKSAAEIYPKVIDGYNALFGIPNPNTANCYKGMASNYTFMGDYEKANDAFNKSLSLYEQLKTKNSEEYQSTLNTKALMLVQKGEWAKAEEIYTGVIAYYKQPGKNIIQYTDIISNLANLYTQNSNYDTALAILIEVIDIRKKELGENDPRYNKSLNNLAFVYESMGDYAKAETIYLKSLAFFEKYYGKESSSYAILLDNISAVYVSLGNYEKAESLLKEALEVNKKIFGPESFKYAEIQNQLSVMYHAWKKDSIALDYAQKSNAIIRKLYGEDDLRYGTSLDNIGILLSGMKQYEQAEKDLLIALDIRRRKLGTDHPECIYPLVNLATLYEDINKMDKAEAYFLEANEIVKKTYPDAHPLQITVANNLGYFYTEANQLDKAELFYRKSIKYKLQELDNNFVTLSEKEKIDYLKQNNYIFNNYLNYSLIHAGMHPYSAKGKIKTPSELPLGESYNIVLARKGMVLASTVKVRQRIQNSGDKTLINKFSEWQSLKNKIAKADRLTKEERQKQQIDLAKMSAESEKMEKELSIVSQDFKSAFNQEIPNWKTIKSNLKPGQAAIEIIRIYSGKDTSIYAALIITPKTVTNPVVAVLPIEGNNLDTRYLYYYKSNIEFKLTDTLSYSVFFKTIADKIKSTDPEVKTIYFSPEGVYNQLNINTLYNPLTKKYIAEEWNIHQLTSTRDILAKQKIKSKSNKIYLFGDPLFDSGLNDTKVNKGEVVEKREIESIDKKTNSLVSMSIKRLPATRTEVNNIETLLKNKQYEVHTYLGEKAVEENIKSIKSAAILHVASHGFFIPTKDLHVTESMLHSGILLAGVSDYYKSKDKLDTEDGILTAYEAQNLELDNTEIVVLSACETGLGESGSSEGVYGLQRALKVAGASVIVMSLWKVDDTATQMLMSDFYKNYTVTGNKREAFRIAQSNLRKLYKDPYYWGAFVMVGE